MLCARSSKRPRDELCEDDVGFVCQHGDTLQEGAEHPHILVTLEPPGSLNTHKHAGETVYPGVSEMLMAIINNKKP